MKSKIPTLFLSSTFYDLKQIRVDHVPPQGGIEIQAVEVENALDFISGRNLKRQFFISQNGVRFKTLCGICNNTELGRKYDPVLNDFAKAVNKYLNSRLVLPDVVTVETKPNSLMRAILGHLLAAKNKIENLGFDKTVRDFVFDETKPIPNNINFFFWIYPYNLTVIVRDFAMPIVRGRFDEIGTFNLLKYSPVAYLITERDQYEGLQSLNYYRNAEPAEVHSIPIRLNFRMHWTWPEFPDPGNIMIMGKGFEDSVYAKPRDKTKQ